MFSFLKGFVAYLWGLVKPAKKLQDSVGDYASALIWAVALLCPALIAWTSSIGPSSKIGITVSAIVLWMFLSAYLGHRKHIDRITPKLMLKFHPSLSVVPDGKREFMWYRVVVTTSSIGGVEGCEGYLVKIEKDGAIVFDHETRQLPFSPNWQTNSATKDIPQDVELPLDVLAIRMSDNHIGIPVVGAGLTEPSDKHGFYLFQGHGEYVFTIKVTSKTSRTVQGKFRLVWSGIYQGVEWSQIA